MGINAMIEKILDADLTRQQVNGITGQPTLAT